MYLIRDISLHASKNNGTKKVLENKNYLKKLLKYLTVATHKKIK